MGCKLKGNQHTWEVFCSEAGSESDELILHKSRSRNDHSPYTTKCFAKAGVKFQLLISAGGNVFPVAWATMLLCWQTHPVWWIDVPENHHSPSDRDKEIGFSSKPHNSEPDCYKRWVTSLASCDVCLSRLSLRSELSVCVFLYPSNLHVLHRKRVCILLFHSRAQS